MKILVIASSRVQVECLIKFALSSTINCWNISSNKNVFALSVSIRPRFGLFSVFPLPPRIGMRAFDRRNFAAKRICRFPFVSNRAEAQKYRYRSDKHDKA